jgi:hypothetical protein
VKEYEVAPAGGDQDRTTDTSVALTCVRRLGAPGSVGNVYGKEGFAPAGVTEFTIRV